MELLDTPFSESPQPLLEKFCIIWPPTNHGTGNKVDLGSYEATSPPNIVQLELELKEENLEGDTGFVGP